MSGSGVWVLCATANGLDTLVLMGDKLPVDGVIGLIQREKTDAISNVADTATFCAENGLQWIGCEKYSLDSANDRAQLQCLDISLLLILGWQRLVPAWLLNHCRIGAVGVHGSHRGITEGRGRSPQNWALIIGAASFEVSIFFAEKGVDDGAVIDTRKFDYGPADDIAVSHQKVNVATAEMICNAWEAGNLNPDFAHPQSAENIAFMPQRQPEDGALDWHRPGSAIDRFVRALTCPYPGAFTEFGGGILKVWRGVTIETPFNETPGTVLAVFQDGSILVATGDGAYLVQETEMLDGNLPVVGDCLQSVSFKKQMFEIIERHQTNYPNMPVSEDIIALSSNKWNMT